MCCLPTGCYLSLTFCHYKKYLRKNYLKLEIVIWIMVSEALLTCVYMACVQAYMYMGMNDMGACAWVGLRSMCEIILSDSSILFNNRVNQTPNSPVCVVSIVSLLWGSPVSALACKVVIPGGMSHLEPMWGPRIWTLTSHIHVKQLATEQFPLPVSEVQVHGHLVLWDWETVWEHTKHRQGKRQREQTGVFNDIDSGDGGRPFPLSAHPTVKDQYD